jgi:hypothetical protein
MSTVLIDRLNSSIIGVLVGKSAIGDSVTGFKVGVEDESVG